MKSFYTFILLTAFVLTSCYSTAPVTDSNESRNLGDARNWVVIMHGEACGNADEVASNMYVENNHDTKTITVTVDISWTENNQPRHENKTLVVGPVAKQLIGCDSRNGIYLKMEIVNAVFN